MVCPSLTGGDGSIGGVLMKFSETAGNVLCLIWCLGVSAFLGFLILLVLGAFH